MKIAFFSAKEYEQTYFDHENSLHKFDIHYFPSKLDRNTAKMAAGMPVVCPFVNDSLNAEVLQQLKDNGTKLIALRSAGFNHVDMAKAKELGLVVTRVPAYSPHAVAEHAVGLILTLNRKIHRAYLRVRESDFSLHGLLGFDIHEKTVGVVGTGEIGSVFCKIMLGFGARVIAYDPKPNPGVEAMDVEYVDLDTLLKESHIISLHCPLNEQTLHMINEKTIAKMRPGVMLINTSRGKVTEAKALIDALKTGQLGALGLDVYEEEANLFFEDHSDELLLDDELARLLTFPNVVITGHQAFFTKEALHNIAATTLNNVQAFASGKGTLHTVEYKPGPEK
jgi:D-lactate dehydrogenase